MALALFLTFFLLLCVTTGEQDFSVKFDSEYPDFKVYVGAKEFLRSGILRIRHGGQWWSSESVDKYSLKLSDNSDEDGADSIGVFLKQK